MPAFKRRTKEEKEYAERKAVKHLQDYFSKRRSKRFREYKRKKKKRNIFTEILRKGR